MKFARHTRAVLETLSSLLAGALDDAATLARLRPFRADHVILDAHLPTPNLPAARRLVTADPAAWCPLPESEAVTGIAGPVDASTSPPWRYRLAIARRADLLSPQGRTLRERRLVDEVTGLAITLPAPRRTLAPDEARGLLAAGALVVSLSWGLTGAAVYVENAARASSEAARTLAASARASGEDMASRNARALIRAITDDEGDLLVARIRISADGAVLTQPDGTNLIPVDNGDEPAPHALQRDAPAAPER